MKVVLFCHSVLSCWNHGNVHFLRGCTREMIRLGHEVVVYEPEDGWSRTNALADGGAPVLAEAAALVPGLTVRTYRGGALDIEQATEGAALVLVHEWTAPALVGAIGGRRAAGAHFTLLFHDTHHRAVTAPAQMNALDLDGYDGVLAFGEVLREVYLERGWGRRAFTWHEAADTALFRPSPGARKDVDLLWIGNWGDDERSEELGAFLLAPIARTGLKARIHGVRYPADVRARLAARGIDHRGWLPNHRAPAALARARSTVHVPRRPYAMRLRGIPTIRVFEALACGVPLVSAPWPDVEGLFPPGAYLTARNEDEMATSLSAVVHDQALAQELTAIGLSTIRARHTCAHRVRELLSIVDDIRAPVSRGLGTAAEKDRVAVS